jgi:hypothetical protein
METSHRHPAASGESQTEGYNKATERATGVRTIGGDKRSDSTITLPPEQALTFAELGVINRKSAHV